MEGLSINTVLEWYDPEIKRPAIGREVFLFDKDGYFFLGQMVYNKVIVRDERGYFNGISKEPVFYFVDTSDMYTVVQNVVLWANLPDLKMFLTTKQ